MLSHLRILDLTDSGTSIAGRILSDLGAEVLLIEPPGGVASRRIAPFVDDLEDPERSLTFWAQHRGKHSIVIDPENEADREDLLALARSADAWIDDRSFRGLGDTFDYEALAELAPQLAFTSITPFGSSGPKARWAATDLTVTAASTVMNLTGDSDRPPLTCSVPQAFFHAGAEAAGAILIALEERARSGKGQHIDISAQTAMMASNQSAVLAAGWGSTPMTRTGGGVSVGPLRIRFIYECLDGFVNLTFLFGEPIGHATARFFDWMDEEGFSNDTLRNEDWVAYGAKIAGQTTTVEAHDAVMEAIERFTRTKTKAELLAAAFEKRLLIVPLSDCRDLVESEHFADRNFWAPIKHSAVDREILHPGPFARMSTQPLEHTRPAPQLGSETADNALARRNVTALSDGLTKSQESDRALPLEGLKVLDFTWVYAGPALTRELADFGATVIKIESATAHDALRANAPFKDNTPGPNRSANFANVNLGKLSLGLNLKTEEGKEIARKLVAWADVVVENFSPKAMKAWELDWEHLREINPSLVMLSSSLAGGVGPHKSLAGYGTMGSAMAGFGFITGWPGRRPSAPYVAYTDYVSPRFGIAAILAAWDHARKTGEGQHIDLSQAEATIHFLGADILDYTANKRIAVARGNANAHYAPSGVYPVAGEDRWIAIAAPSQGTFERLSESAGRGWLSDPRFADEASRLVNFEALDNAISEWSRDQDVSELEAKLQALRIPAHRVANSFDAFEDPQLEAIGHFIDLEYADLGPVPFEACRARLSATPAVSTTCPTLGEHNQKVLSETLGLDDDAITDLIIAGAIE